MNNLPLTASAALLAGAALVLSLGAASAETIRWARVGDALTMDPHSQNEGPTIRSITISMRHLWAAHLMAR